MKSVAAVLLILVTLFIGAQVRAPQPTQPLTAVGRYQLFSNPNIRADTFLLDTQTGKIWRQMKYTDIQDEPTVWKFELRIDNESELIDWASKQTIKPTPKQ